MSIIPIFCHILRNRVGPFFKVPYKVWAVVMIQEGQTAPDSELKASIGGIVSLSGFREQEKQRQRKNCKDYRCYGWTGKKGVR